MNLEGKVVVITGGSRGLGKELARALVSKGAAVVVSSYNAEDLEKAANETGAMPIAADVRQEADVKALAEKTAAKFGKVDIWFNNAGVWLPHAPVEEMNMDRVHDMFEVNVFGTMYGSKQALLLMRKQGGGAIVNIISTSALEGRPLSSGYSASKCAADGFTKSLRKEVQADNIRIIAVYPGGMQTELFREQPPEDYGDYMDPAKVAERIIANLEKELPEEELILKRGSV